jgi:DNA-dependent RNA polymerase auxiliary subunit epsilon
MLTLWGYDMSDEISNRRPYIIELLQLLASEEEQLAYERNVPHVNITVELLCMWFDDRYHPDEAVFVSCFTTDELSALAEFHRFYDERKDQLPPGEGTVRTWLDSPVWRDVMLKAKSTLEQIAA